MRLILPNHPWSLRFTLGVPTFHRLGPYVWVNRRFGVLKISWSLKGVRFTKGNAIVFYSYFFVCHHHYCWISSNTLKKNIGKKNSIFILIPYPQTISPQKNSYSSPQKRVGYSGDNNTWYLLKTFFLGGFPFPLPLPYQTQVQVASNRPPFCRSTRWGPIISRNALARAPLTRPPRLGDEVPRLWFRGGGGIFHGFFFPRPGGCFFSEKRVLFEIPGKDLQTKNIRKFHKSFGKGYVI